jgi:undecaprenyl-diphosphatase
VLIWLQVIILGVVEGITEFLPISSTGHLIVTSELLRFKNSIGGTFEIFIQLGAILAVVGFYARDLWAQATALFGLAGEKREGVKARRFWLTIVVAFLPAAIIGLSLHHWIKRVLFSPWVIAWSLILGGIVFLVVERYFPRRTARTQELMQISFAQALAIGAAQTLALIPGVSRSGSSMIGGMLAGLDRPTATIFSFYLAIPTLGGATILDLLKNLDQLAPGDLSRLLLGTAVSFIVAWASIRWLLRYVSRHSLVAFGWYRIVMGAGLLGLIGFKIL